MKSPLRLEVLFALKKIGRKAKPAGPALITLLKTATGYDRLNAAEALWRIDQDVDIVVPALAESLKDSFLPIRRDAANALGEIGPRARGAVSALIAARDVHAKAASGTPGNDNRTAGRTGRQRDSRRRVLFAGARCCDRAVSRKSRMEGRKGPPHYPGKTHDGYAMRLPRMTIRRWVVFIAVAALDVALIVQTASHPLAHSAFFATLFVVILSPVMLALFMLAADS